MYRVILFVVTLIALCIVYVISSSYDFERISPLVKLSVIKYKSNIVRGLDFDFYNPENLIKVVASDSSGIRWYSIKILDSNSNIISNTEEVVLKKTSEIDINIPLIKTYLNNGDKIKLIIKVRDWSNANLFRGNETKLERELVIAKESLNAEIISFSNKILYGGSALIAFSVKGNVDNIDKIVVSNGTNLFNVYKYKNSKGNSIYLSLVAWPVENTFFDGSIKIIDKALNEHTTKVNITKQISIISRQINVRLSKNSLENAIDNINIPQIIDNPIDKFKFINEDMRNKDNDMIKNKFKNIYISNNLFPQLSVINPLKNMSINDHFNNKRIYFYNKDKIGVHKSIGMTLASRDHGVYANNAYIVYVGNTKTYGNIAILNFALGLNVVYGNLDKVYSKSYIDDGQFATIGSKGFLFDKRLFIAVLIDGNFVNPNEWLNKTWFDLNIQSVLDTANMY